MISKLGLGGHSFYSALGSEPVPSEEEQCRIVAACLDSGIRWVDTTYAPEREALGRCLRTLGRRKEALITAWNFFKDEANETPKYMMLEPHHIGIMLEELGTDYLDLLVIHTHEDRVRLREEIALAESWQREGIIGGIGLGMARMEHLLDLPADTPVSALLTPYNYFSAEAEDMFKAAKQRGMRTFALSPFVRGWKLEQPGVSSSVTPGLLLRWAACRPETDHVIVSMRRSEWVSSNIKAVELGPVREEEEEVMRGWQ